jgi:pimeloyl-ACP methyl ester carboxylesterase
LDKYTIDKEEFININGDAQSIRIRAKDTTKPLLLFLHGGPGIADRHYVFRYQNRLADDFILVCWDQRASARSYKRANAKEKLTVAQYVEDTRAVSEYLLKQFGKEKLYVTGHSWGSLLGVLFCAKYPSLVAGYAGTGQFVSEKENEDLSYLFCLNTARSLGDAKAVKALEAVKPENGAYKNQRAMMIQRQYLTKYGGTNFNDRRPMISAMLCDVAKSPEYGFRRLTSYAKGALLTTKVMFDEISRVNFFETVKKLEIPVLILQGRHDYNTPSELALRWYEALDAPSKKWVWLENSAHSPANEEPEKWNAAILSLLDMK